MAGEPAPQTDDTGERVAYLHQMLACHSRLTFADVE
jgi:hypothetical protein